MGSGINWGLEVSWAEIWNNYTWPVAAAVTASAITGGRAGTRFMDFFAANIRNPHTRRAYARDVKD